MVLIFHTKPVSSVPFSPLCQNPPEKCVFLIYLCLAINAYENNENHRKSLCRVGLSLCWTIFFFFSCNLFLWKTLLDHVIEPLVRETSCFSFLLFLLPGAPTDWETYHTTTLVNNERAWKSQFQGLSCFPVQSTEKLSVASKSIRCALRVEFTSVQWATSKWSTICILAHVLLGTFKRHFKGSQAADLQL